MVGKEQNTIFTKSDLLEKKIDCHTHSVGIELNMMYDFSYPTTSDLLHLSSEIQCSIIDYAITFPMPTPLYFDIIKYRTEGNFISTGFGEFPFEYENRTLLAGIKKFKVTNILPFLSFSLNDKVDEQAEYIDMCCSNKAIYGLKYHTMADQHSAIDLQNHSSLMNVIIKNNLPIMFHSGKREFQNPLLILQFAKTNPYIRVCVAHFGRFEKRFCAELESSEYPNVYIDTSPFSNICTQNARLMTKGDTNIIKLNYNSPVKVLADMYNRYKSKLIWGTDFPWNCQTGLLDDSEIDCSYYNEEVDILLNNLEMAENIASKNTNRFLFG